MKIKITFDTSDPDQRLEHLQMIHALPALGALYDIDQLLARHRDRIEESTMPEKERRILEQTFALLTKDIQGILEEHGINLETLYP
jgi:hypothetical protein